MNGIKVERGPTAGERTVDEDRRDRERREEKREEKDRDKEEEDAVDEAVEDSFPASDPPPWTLGREAHDKGA